MTTLAALKARLEARRYSSFHDPAEDRQLLFDITEARVIEAAEENEKRKEWQDKFSHNERLERLCELEAEVERNKQFYVDALNAGDDARKEAEQLRTVIKDLPHTIPGMGAMSTHTFNIRAFPRECGLCALLEGSK